MVLAAVLLVVLPLLSEPVPSLTAFGVILLGIPVYIFVVMETPWRFRPKVFDKISGEYNTFITCYVSHPLYLLSLSAVLLETLAIVNVLMFYYTPTQCIICCFSLYMCSGHVRVNKQSAEHSVITMMALHFQTLKQQTEYTQYMYFFDNVIITMYTRRCYSAYTLLI